MKARPIPDESQLNPAELSALIETLRHENEALREQLEHVIDTASNNEMIWRHFAEIERTLLSTRQLDLLVDDLMREIKTRFRPDQVILLISHPDVLERFFPEISKESAPIAAGTWILPVPGSVVDSLCGNSITPLLLSRKGLEKLLPFMPREVSQVRSGVFIPLRTNQIPFGGLFLGSADAQHYRPEDGTDLLEQLGIKIVLCMDNCLSYERVKDFALQDSVTGLLNIFQVHTVLERELRKAKRLGTPLSVLMIDLSFYHDMDDYLDEMGSHILKHVADMLKNVLPERECILGRYGSDEFLLLLPNVQEEEAREVAPHLIQRIRKTPFKYHNTAVLIQATIGVGALNEKTKRSQDLLDDVYADLCRLKMLRHQPGS